MARKTAKKTKATKKLACPECGWDASDDGLHDSSFRFIEDVTNEYRVEGYSAAGVLEVSDLDRVTVEGEETSRRIRCGNCLHEFPLASRIKLDFV